MKKNILKPIDIVFAILGTISILIFVIHYSSLFVSAESSYFPMHQNDNGHFNADSMALIDSYFNSADNNIFVKYIDYNYYCVSYSKSSSGGVYGEIYSNGTNFSLYTSGSVSISVKQFQIMYGSIVNVSNWGTNLYYFNNSPSSLYNASVDYISNYRVYTNSNKTDTVLMYGQEPFEPAQGHATSTGFDNSDNINTDGHAQQPSTPIFPTFPTITIDTTNVETLLQSIFDVLSSIGDFIAECFSVFFSWLVSVIQNGLQAIINTIRDFADTFYNNMLSLFEPIAQNIEYLVQPISSSVIYDNISSTSLVSNIGTIESSLTTFSNSFNNLSEPTTYTIPIHLENITMFGTLTTQYIDLSVINPVKNIIRVFAWAMVTYGLFITIVDSISNYINGGQDE